MTNTKLTTIATLLIAGCGLEQPAPQGLVLDRNDATHVTGTFGRDGTAIAFEFTTDGTSRRAEITSLDGRPLLASALTDGRETTTYLGRLTLEGRDGQAEPTASGDADAFGELARSEEAPLVHDLREQLHDAGVVREMFAAPRPEKGSTQGWNATTLQCGQRIAVPTYSWWWPVETRWHNTSPYYYASLRINDGAITYYQTEAPAGQGYFRDRYDYWSWWTVYWTNLCSYGPAPVWFDSQLL